MPDSPASSHLDLSKVGYGALGNVDVHHDASQHTAHNTTNNISNNSTSTSHTHQEDNSQHHHLDQSVSKHTTVHQSGIPPALLFGIICVVVAGLVLTILALKQDRSPPAVITVTTPPLSPIPSPPVMVAKDNPPVVTPISPAPIPARPLELTLNHSSYAEGQLMEITVASQQAGYLYVLAVWGDGRVDTLFPNSLMPNGKITAGTRLRLPNDFPPSAGGEVLRYPMGMPALPGNPATATESIVAVLSPTPLNLPQSTELASMPGFAAVGMMNDPEFRSRGPQPKFMKMQKAPTLDFGDLPQAAVHYEVHR